MYFNTIEEIVKDENKRNDFFNSLENCISMKNTFSHTKLDKFFGRTLEHKHICKCLHQTINKENLGNFKYNGRYVFLCIWGCYEFFSVVFSFMSVLLCITKYFKHKKVLKEITLNDNVFSKETLFYRNIYFLLSFATCSSSVFLHIHENHWTTKCDYLFAMLLIIHTSILFSDRTKNLFKHSNYWYNIFKTASALVFTYILYDQYYSNNFDAVFNKTVSGFFICILLGNFLIHHFKQNHPTKKRHLFLMALYLLISLFFELIDMPPIFYLIDSHAMWHLALFLCYHHISEYIIIDTL